MKNSMIALLMAAVSLTVCGQAYAQDAGPPAQMRSQLQQIRNDAKTAAFNALSADHRSRVQNIIVQFNSGSLDRQTATQQIDAVLSPAESQAVLAQGARMRDAMRTAFSQGGFGGSMPQGGRHREGGFGGSRAQPDAGRALLRLGADRRAMRPQS